MTLKYFVLSVRQPYADLLAMGIKRYETRDWACNRRGLILIHSSKTYSAEDKANRDMLVRGGFPAINSAIGARDYKPALGCILAVAVMTGCYTSETLKMTEVDNRAELLMGNYGPGRYGFEIHAKYLLPEPIPARGQLNFWMWQGEILGVSREKLREWHWWKPQAKT